MPDDETFNPKEMIEQLEQEQKAIKRQFNEDKKLKLQDFKLEKKTRIQEIRNEEGKVPKEIMEEFKVKEQEIKEEIKEMEQELKQKTSEIKEEIKNIRSQNTTNKKLSKKEDKKLKKEEEKKLKEENKQRIRNQKDSIFDFDYGIKCNVRLPPREVISSRSGLTKGAATLGFGLVGMAATSGTKTKLKTDFKINILVSVKDQGLILHNAAPDKSDVFVEWNHIKDCKYSGKTFIKSTNDVIIILVNGHKLIITSNTKHNKKDAAKQLYDIIESKMCGDEGVWENNSEENNSSNADELLKWHELYEKGVISEEEFEQKKKELL